MSRKRNSTSKTKGGNNNDNTYQNNGRGTSRDTRYTRRNKGKERSDEVKSTNDPAWYSANAELLRDAASIPFSWPVGTTLGNANHIYQDTVPGVLCLELSPTIGSSLTMNAPINVASNAIYSFVRHANSGHSNYDAPDLMMYLLAMSHIYSFVTWCQRLLGVVNMYDQRNRYTPYALVTANWVNFEDLKNNIANFRYWLNNYITKVASLAVPATMNVFSRLAFLYSNVYIDGPTPKDQMYMYIPDVWKNPWMKFSLDSNQVGQLEWVIPNKSLGGYMSIADIEAYGNTLFNAIWDQEDFGIMSGDILKAYGDNIIKLAPVPVDFQLAPIYDTMVLHQMKNAKHCNGYDISKITQTNGIISQLVFVDSTMSVADQRTAKQYGELSKVLSSDFDHPTPDVVIESTRLIYGYDSITNYVHCGTELCKRLTFWQFANNGTLGHKNIDWTSFKFVQGATVTYSNVQAVGMLGLYTHAFKYCPEFLCLETDSNGNLTNWAVRWWDIDNYAVLNQDDIIKMHEAALMSLFAVPAIAKIS